MAEVKVLGMSFPQPLPGPAVQQPLREKPEHQAGETPIYILEAGDTVGCHQMGQAAGKTYAGNGEFSPFAQAKVARGCQMRTDLQ